MGSESEESEGYAGGLLKESPRPPRTFLTFYQYINGIDSNFYSAEIKQE